MFEQIEGKIKYLSENNDLLTDLYLYNSFDEYQTDLVLRRIENTMASIMSTQEGIDYTAVLIENGPSFSFNVGDISSELLEPQLDKGEDWYQIQLNKHKYLCRTEQIEIDYTSQLEVTFVFLINIEEIEELLASAIGTPRQKIVIVESNDVLVAGEFLNEEIVHEVTERVIESELVIKNMFGKSDYDLNGLLLILLFFVVIIIVSSVTLYLVYESIRIPLNHLLDRIEGINNDRSFMNNEDYMDEESMDEHVILNNEFTSMINRLNELLEETYLRNIRETELSTRIKELELVALQQRINPHFLYNILDNVFWMAQMNGYDEIGEMVTALGDYFKTSVSQKSDFVTISTELENVRSYICLQKIMHENQFIEFLDIDPEILRFKTVKLILQPVIENCIVHGFEAFDSGGIIRITGKIVHENIIFEIMDNGQGMTEEDCLTLSNNMNNNSVGIGESIGMRNVNQRIKIYFGEDYGISIKSSLDSGTSVTLCIPIKE